MGSRGGFRPASAKIPTEKCRPRVRIVEHVVSGLTISLVGTLAPTKSTEDVAYRHERMLFRLSTADRLRNSHSYARFAIFFREIHLTRSATAAPTGISKLHPAAWWGGVVVAMSQSRLQVLQWQ
jgi:hypothetical protein